MDAKIKKKLVKNWFKVLQDIICKDIEEIESTVKDIRNRYPNPSSVRR